HLGVNAKLNFGQSGNEHQDGREYIAASEGPRRSGSNQISEQKRRRCASDSSAEFIENCDSERPRFQRKNLTGRQIGGACCRRREKERRIPRDRLCPRG